MARKSKLLHAVAIFMSCQSTALASGTLRGVSGDIESPITSSHDGGGEDTQTRHLYGRQYSQGIEALTQTRASLSLQHQGDEIQVANSTTTLHSLEGLPVYFEAQAEDPASNPYLRIVGGSASPEQRNFCMHLRWDVYSNQYVFAGCGGVLIGNCHVLTAAHCSIGSRSGLPDGVFVNAYNPFQGNYGRAYHFSTVTNIIMHPSYSSTTNQNDIAILELDTCVPDLSQYPVMKVAGPSFLSQLTSSTSLVVSGFGRTSEFSTAQVQSLQRVSLPYISQSACNTFYPGRIYGDMICAGQVSGGLDACQGDSGGPLFYQGAGGDSDQTVVGVVSWGSGCAQPAKPGVYASVAYFYDWIKNTVCNNSRTNRAIALCTTSFSLTPSYSLSSTATTSASSFLSTCSSMHQECTTKPCCGGFVCRSRSTGAAPTCSLPASSTSRSSLTEGQTVPVESGGSSSGGGN